MNIPLVYFLGLAVAFVAMGIWRREWLLSIWAVSILLFPTAQARLAGAPIYLYDLTAAILIAAFAASGELNRWPRHVPRWHWWFIGAALVLSVGFGFVRFGFLPQIVWIWGHASLAWMAFAFGVIVLLSNCSARYVTTLRWTLLAVSVPLCAIALVQFIDLSGSERISALFYGDLGSEKSVEILRLGKQANRATGPHFAPTSFGGIAVLTGMVYWLLTDERHRWSRILVGLMSCTTMLCTVSRHVMVALVIGLAAFIVASELRRKAKLILTCAAVAVVLSTTAIGFLAKEGWSNRLGRWDEGILNDENIAMRVLYGPTRLINSIAAEPSILITGAGLDPEKLVSRNNHASQNESGFVSNGFLLALYYLGIGGFVLHAVFWWWTWRLGRDFPRSQRPLLNGVVLATVVIVASDNYSFMYEPAVAVLVLIAGLIAGRRHQLWTGQSEWLEQSEEPPEPAPRPLRGGAYAS